MKPLLLAFLKVCQGKLELVDERFFKKERDYAQKGDVADVVDGWQRACDAVRGYVAVPLPIRVSTRYNLAIGRMR